MTTPPLKIFNVYFNQDKIGVIIAILPTRRFQAFFTRITCHYLCVPKIVLNTLLWKTNGLSDYFPKRTSLSFERNSFQLFKPSWINVLIISLYLTTHKMLSTQPFHLLKSRKVSLIWPLHLLLQPYAQPYTSRCLEWWLGWVEEPLNLWIIAVKPYTLV